jgi:signal transduction histidine kinase
MDPQTKTLPEQWQSRIQELEKCVGDQAARLALQDRELEIEGSLESIRKETNRMSRSEDLLAVIAVTGAELEKLGIDFDSTNFRTNTRERDWDLWVYAKWMPVPMKWHVPFIDHPYFLMDTLDGGVVSGLFTKEEKQSFDEYLVRLGHIKLSDDPATLAGQQKAFKEAKGFAMSIASINNVSLNIANSRAEPYDAEQNAILLRCTIVFEQAYTRFIDLQKAESQAREAQIEAGLERVRYSAMAMQSSEDVSAASAVVFNEISLLGVEAMRCGITVIHPDKTADVWAATTTSEGREMKGVGSIDFGAHPLWTGLFEAWENKRENFSYELKGDDLIAYYQVLSQSPHYDSSYISGQQFPDHFIYASLFEQGAVFTFSLLPHTDEKRRVIDRFTNVFSLTFRRYLDLRKAEAQTREALIEAGLERVRSRAMAMRSSDELRSLIGIVFHELTKLDFVLTRCIIQIFDPETDDCRWWTLNSEMQDHPTSFLIPYHEHPAYLCFVQAWKQRSEHMEFDLKGELKTTWDDFLFTKSGLKDAPPEVIHGMRAPDRVLLTACFNNFGGLNVASLAPLSIEQTSILKRFAKVFDLTYSRFNDLQKAEAQAREAEIQLALERVRARTMAMQRSEELAETCELLFEEFRKLHIVEADQQGTDARATIGIFNEPEGCYELWVTGLDGKKLDHIFKLSLEEPIHINKAFTAWKEGRPSLVVDMRGEELNRWFDHLREVGLPINPELYNKRRVNTWAFFSKGNLGITTIEPLPEEFVQLLQRFADTFNITYTRFQDLKDAEARTQTAIKEASLDRIRAEIASMRTADDLQRITPSVWRELRALGVPFFRCGVMIVEEEKQVAHFYLTAPDGKPLAALELSTVEDGLTKHVVEQWHTQQTFVSHWTSEEFKQFAEDLVSRQQVANMQTYQGGSDSFPSLTLQFLPFAQGMLYVGSESDLTAEQMDLVGSVAAAFSTAYARYEDFTRLEAAKQQIEATLKDLRVTQHQLIQSEKMASLGELTAGIAHEIQNPLNFVNNFSEVSTELVEEMNEEMQKGNIEDAKQIAQDLKDNLEKITHHGKRAGDIVKGMLQHSRKSNGEKEPVDINALADEYLRLAFHGLRAKDKSFQSNMKTELDPSIGMIAVIQQDIGRVILNLVTNAFFAVDEKKKQVKDGYNPLVIVQTRKHADNIEIIVKDNGNGIPQKILDKIFQPFFTTKPTGQGTGLGLSLSYDIVKAHGGELVVETKEKEGSVFTIQLPANKGHL